MKKKIRIGNSSGFWGDEPHAMERQVRLGQLDYLTADYLAEVSMSILAKQQAHNADLGYVPDFIDHVKAALGALKVHFPKMVTNAGGNNPIGCAKALQRLLRENGFHQKVMAVSGDNLAGDISGLSQNNNPFINLETGEPFEKVKDRLVSANAYASSEGIVSALGFGADIVICGRVSDSALTIGPMIHEFGWNDDDWDLLASGMVAGHIIECGAQASGGNFTDWEHVNNWQEMGYPIIEMSENGNFIVTKPESTGGMVNQWTVKEQLVYEIADPKVYMGPDVVADLTTLEVKDTGPDTVSVEGVRGYPAPTTWKVSMAYNDGYRATGMVVVGGQDAFQKARLTSKIFWNRFSVKFDKTNTNLIGANALGASLATNDPKEILLQFIAFDKEKEKLILFSREVAGLILSGPQGLAAYGGRPEIKSVVAYWPTLVEKKDIKIKVWTLSDQKVEEMASFTPANASEQWQENEILPGKKPGGFSLLKRDHGLVRVQLKALCLARSGDKGNSTNLGVLARNEAIFNYLKDHLSVDIIHSWFSDLCQGELHRYVLENLLAFNFVMERALDGGGTRSGRLDPQGKMLASAFLAQEVFVPGELLMTE